MRWAAILCVCLASASIGLIVEDGGCSAECCGAEEQEQDRRDAPDPCSNCTLGCCNAPCTVAAATVQIASATPCASIPETTPTAHPPLGVFREILHVPRNARV